MRTRGTTEANVESTVLVAGGVSASMSKQQPIRSALDIGFIVKKAAISAAVAIVLFSLMVGIRTEAGPTGQLIYWTRFDDLATLVATVFVGSIALELLRWWWGSVGTEKLVPPVVKTGIALAGRLVAPALLVFTFLVPVIFYDQRYILDLAILVLTYVMLGWGLNVVVGLAGLLDLGYVAFYAVGAYSYALLATNFGLSFWICLPLAGMLAACCEAEPGEEALVALGRESQARWPAFAAELKAISGTDVELRTEGTLVVASTADDQARLHHHLVFQQKLDLPLEWISAAETRDAPARNRTPRTRDFLISDPPIRHSNQCAGRV